MALPPRFQWIAENVASAFNIRNVENIIQENLNYKKLNEFLEGKTKQQHIFFFYQRPDMLNEHNEPVDGHKDCKLTITTGENERIKSFAVYFLRFLGPGRSDRCKGKKSRKQKVSRTGSGRRANSSIVAK